MLNPTLVRRFSRGALTLIIFATAFVLAPQSAEATECVPVAGPDGVVIPCETEGEPGDPGGPGEPGDGGNGNTPRECALDGRAVPCSSEFGSWDGNCYVRSAVDPVPPKGAPVWEGNDDGLIIECNPHDCLGGPSPCPDRTLDWAAEPPAQVGMSAEQLAAQAVASLGLSTGAIGSTPPTFSGNPNAVGTIGLPIWLWIADRAPNTTGPITSRPATDGALSVTATGTLDHVEWTLTDANGTVVGAISCGGANAPGTPYDGRNSAEPSPTCGFGADLNNSPGNLTLTGTAYWSVEWQGGGQSGHIDFTAESNSTQIRIGELQMLVQD
jgi:hypothetical protein